MPEGAARLPPGTPADPRMNTVVKRVLRIGLALAIVLLVVGLALELAGGERQGLGVHIFDLFASGTVGRKILALGVLALALTPVAGVVTLVAGWFRERDRVFAGVGLVVVVILAAAVLVGLAG